MLLSEIYERYLGRFTLQRAPISHLISHLAHQSQELSPLNPIINDTFSMYRCLYSSGPRAL
ncbi:hypothetical protein ARMSODRAFT_214518 [Armillaria solidipes]|uniref:Uncharacterized protein n=1 Tax=Armillaria solidipes TaxID=1076256 RepID=A0A2H3BMY2_9AGAR|nr:hypothetical protein ARMSODRAFT_214518 [Armillaria solidipes]